MTYPPVISRIDLRLFANPGVENDATQGIINAINHANSVAAGAQDDYAQAFSWRPRVAVYFPGGLQWRTTSPIEISIANVMLLGDGVAGRGGPLSGTSVLVKDHPGDAIVINAASGLAPYNTQISGLCIRPLDPAQRVGKGITIVGPEFVAGLSIRGVRVLGLGHGIYVNQIPATGIAYMDVQDSQFSNNAGWGIYINNRLSNSTLSRLNVNGNGSGGIYASGFASIIEQINAEGQDNPIVVGDSNSGRLDVRRVYFELNTVTNPRYGQITAGLCHESIFESSFNSGDRPWKPLETVYAGSIRGSRGRQYVCRQSGITSSNSQPSTEGTNVIDGGVLWDFFGYVPVPYSANNTIGATFGDAVMPGGCANMFAPRRCIGVSSPGSAFAAVETINLSDKSASNLDMRDAGAAGCMLVQLTDPLAFVTRFDGANVRMLSASSEYQYADQALLLSPDDVVVVDLGLKYPDSSDPSGGIAGLRVWGWNGASWITLSGSVAGAIVSADARRADGSGKGAHVQICGAFRNLSQFTYSQIRVAVRPLGDSGSALVSGLSVRKATGYPASYQPLRVSNVFAI